ncbi:hypothetical protein PsYK624_047980 [Phanerochaete sordida]|uniref:Uncharacterized protein n=1 Tax=Phanerochaete sordida TaxID=48140 RepID=A0A9P3G6H3_9APHY|nr:hypothetical protein PsYK624_047980 [Phanerochaete sordida]
MDAFSHSEDVSALIRSFGDPKISLAQRPLCIGLAPDRAKCCDKDVGEVVKVSVATVTRSLSKIPAGEKHWETVLSAMAQVPLLESDGNNIHRSATFSCRSSSSFSADGEPSLQERISCWLFKLVGDEAIMDSLAVDALQLALSRSVSRCTSQRSWSLFRGTRRELPLLDINVLRFPDSDRPFFELYRLRVDAWSQSWPFYTCSRATDGLTGVFQSHKFRMQKSLIYEVSRDTLDKAVEEAEIFLEELSDRSDSESSSSTLDSKS